MKKFSTLLLIVLFSPLFNAQFSDLGTLSEGNMVNFQTILNNDDQVYGYMAIYELDKTDDQTKKFEYIFLDKNLNKVSSQEFESNTLTEYFSAYLTEREELILKPRYQIYTKRDMRAERPRSYTVDMKNNTIQYKNFQCFEKNELVNCAELRSETIKEDVEAVKKERKANGFVEQSYSRELEDGGYLIYTYKDMGKKEKKSFASDNRMIRFDKDKNVLWEHTFNENADKKNNEDYYMIEWDDDYAYFLKEKIVKKKAEHYFLVFDMDKGKILKEVNLRDYYATFYPSQLFYFNNSRVDNTYSNDEFFKLLTTFYSGGVMSGTYQSGYSTLTYDKKRNEIRTDNLYFSDLISYIDITPSGKMGSYHLHERDAYFLKDGSVGILTEKGKYKSNGKLVTTDMVLITTDKHFRPTQVNVLEKSKTKSFGATDYLFAQHLNDDKDMVFFYRDYEKDDETKDKNWNLYINTIIDGKFKQESIPISSDDNFIYPSLAKEGYILLREYNKNDKYDQIRLERLNY